MLVPCLECGRHIRSDDTSCPHCATPKSAALRQTTAAVALGLAVACSGGKNTPWGGSQVDYGGSWSDTDTDVDTDTDADADADVDADTDTDTSDTGL